MRVTLALATACALFSVPAFAQTPNPNTPSSNPLAATGARTGAAAIGTQPGGTLSSRDFVNQVAIDNMFDVQAARLAEQKGDNPDKTFAKREISHHDRATTELKNLVMNKKVNAPVPTGLDSEYQQKIEALQKMSGKQFDEAFSKDMIQSHRNEIALFDQYTKDGNNADLKHWASENLPELREHLTNANKLS